MQNSYDIAKCQSVTTHRLLTVIRITEVTKIWTL